MTRTASWRMPSTNITPHVAQKKHSAIDGRTTRHAGYNVSQRRRKGVEECFGWMKTIGLMSKVRHRGLQSWMDVYICRRRL